MSKKPYTGTLGEGFRDLISEIDVEGSRAIRSMNDHEAGSERFNGRALEAIAIHLRGLFLLEARKECLDLADRMESIGPDKAQG